MKIITTGKNTLSFIDERFYLNLIVIFFGILINSFLEMISLASIIPIISTFFEPMIIINFITNNELNFILLPYENFESITLENYLLGLSIFIFLLLILFKNIFSFVFLSYRAKVLYEISLDIRINKIKNIISAPYNFFLKKNNSVILTETQWLNNIKTSIENYLNIFIEIFLLIAVIIVILYANFFASISVILFLSLVFLIILYITKQKILSFGQERKVNEREQIKTINNILNGIKEIKIFFLEKIFLEKFITFSKGGLNANRKFFIYSNFPKFIIEIAVALSIFLIFLVSLLNNLDQKSILMTLSLFAVSTFKIIPSVNKIIISYNSLKYIEKIIDELYAKKNDEINYSKKRVNFVEFSKSLELKNISFKYDDKNKILKNFNLKILKGEKIFIKGNSGSGKSTIINLIIGLLTHDEGKIIIDDIKAEKNFCIKNCSLVSQTPFYFNDTILNNICLNSKNIDYEKLNKIKITLELEKIIDNKINKFETNIGEKGNNLSGGQLQRINLARALYNNPNLLILDEATNALDKNTEERILKNIFEQYKSMTIILISHDTQIVNLCDRVYKIGN